MLFARFYDLAQLKYCPTVPHAYMDAAPKAARCLMCLPRVAMERESLHC